VGYIGKPDKRSQLHTVRVDFQVLNQAGRLLLQVARFFIAKNLFASARKKIKKGMDGIHAFRIRICPGKTFLTL
jgi:hypothetical protein